MRCDAPIHTQSSDTTILCDRYRLMYRHEKVVGKVDVFQKSPPLIRNTDGLVSRYKIQNIYFPIQKHVYMYILHVDIMYKYM